jgi:hypothetical protein
MGNARRNARRNPIEARRNQVRVRFGPPPNMRLLFYTFMQQDTCKLSELESK